LLGEGVLIDLGGLEFAVLVVRKNLGVPKHLLAQ
jgi:hypothetical protein